LTNVDENITSLTEINIKVLEVIFCLGNVVRTAGQ